MFEKALGDFWLYFATIDPFGTLIIFSGLTGRLAKSAQRRVAVQGVLVAAAVLLVFMALGQISLNGLSIRMEAFEIAGSIVLFLFGLQMFFMPASTAQDEDHEGHSRDIAIFPLALPSIASPGAILAVMLATENNTTPIPLQVASAASLLVVLALTLILLLLAEKVNKVIGRSGEKVLVRISGLILTSLACEFCIQAFESLLQSV